MDTKQISRNQQVCNLRLEYLMSALHEINSLQKEVQKIEDHLFDKEKILVRDFIRIAFKIRNISNRCAEIIYYSEKFCSEYFTNSK